MMRSVVLLLLGIIFPLTASYANDQEAHYLAVGEAGYRYHNGASGKSWNKAGGEFLYFQAESRRGPFCPNLGVALEFISGNATAAQGDVSGSGFTGGLFPGLDIFPVRGGWEPFLEVHGVLSWNYAALSPVVPSQDEKTLSLGFGYEAGVGVHIKYHGHRAYRLHLSYLSYTAKQAATAGFQYNAYSVSLGLAF